MARPPKDAPPYEFLSDPWLHAARALRDEAGDPASPVVIAMNLTVTEPPFSADPVVVNLDTSRGVLAFERGAAAAADVTVTIDWLTAKALLVNGDTTAVMAAFMAGKVQIEGDMAKVVSLQTASLDPSSQRVLEGLRRITA